MPTSQDGGSSRGPSAGIMLIEGMSAEAPVRQEYIAMKRVKGRPAKASRTSGTSCRNILLCWATLMRACSSTVRPRSELTNSSWTTNRSSPPVTPREYRGITSSASAQTDAVALIERRQKNLAGEAIGPCVSDVGFIVAQADGAGQTQSAAARASCSAFSFLTSSQVSRFQLGFRNRAAGWKVAMTGTPS